MIQISLDKEFAKSFYEEEQAQILQDKVYAKQVEAQWIADEERIPQEAKQTDEREKLLIGMILIYEDIRPIFERVRDQNQAFVPKDSEIEKEVMKSPGFDLQQESSKKTGGSRKKTLARKRAGEKQSKEENFMYYQIISIDGSSKNYKISSEMLNDFDRQDVMDLHRLVEERIHILLMDNGIAIHMMIEKKYPLTQEMLSKMLSRKLEVDHENEMAFELLREITSLEEDCWELNVYILSTVNTESMTEDINADWETRYAREGNEINIIDGVMICFKEKI
ncbi:hypothetical protein Tco_1350361 [Tanacetum coccineum]